MKAREKVLLISIVVAFIMGLLVKQYSSQFVFFVEHCLAWAMPMLSQWS